MNEFHLLVRCETRGRPSDFLSCVGPAQRDRCEATFSINGDAFDERKRKHLINPEEKQEFFFSLRSIILSLDLSRRNETVALRSIDLDTDSRLSC